MFDETVMPSSRSRVTKGAFISKQYVPLAADNRKRKAPLKKNCIHDVYSIYKTFRLSPSDLIKILWSINPYMHLVQSSQKMRKKYMILVAKRIFLLFSRI